MDFGMALIALKRGETVTIIDCLHYAIDHFDRKSDVGMTICKGNKIIMTFENGR